MAIHGSVFVNHVGLTLIRRMRVWWFQCVAGATRLTHEVDSEPVPQQGNIHRRKGAGV